MSRSAARSFAAVLLTAAVVLVGPFAARARAQQWRDLALAAFDQVWQVIQDTYHDPAFGGLDWVGVRQALRPELAAVETPDAARDVIRTMLGRLGQSHFVLLPPAPSGQPAAGAAVPIDVRLVDEAVIVSAVVPGSTAARAGIRPGDQILEVDGRPATALAPAAGSSVGREARLALIRAVLHALTGPPSSTARLLVSRPGGRVESLAVPRVPETGEAVTIGNLPSMRVRTSVAGVRTPAGQEVGVIGFNVWMPAVAEPFAQAVDRYRESDGLVIDLRGNPGGLADMIRGVSGHLLDEPRLVGRIVMRDVNLEIRANPRRSTTDGRRVEPFTGPVAVLVDELTGSASECFTGGLQSLGRVRVFGRRTMGQALPAATRELANGDVLLYAVGDFVTSTGARLEGTGVVPDETVPLTVADLAAGRDADLDAALDWIDRVRPAAPAAGE